jgi:hypothetical protein
MVKSLPIIMANNAERTEDKLKPRQLIQHGLLITPLLETQPILSICRRNPCPPHWTAWLNLLTPS